MAADEARALEEVDRLSTASRLLQSSSTTTTVVVVVAGRSTESFFLCFFFFLAPFDLPSLHNTWTNSEEEIVMIKNPSKLIVMIIKIS